MWRKWQKEHASPHSLPIFTNTHGLQAPAWCRASLSRSCEEVLESIVPVKTSPTYARTLVSVLNVSPSREGSGALSTRRLLKFAGCLTGCGWHVISWSCALGKLRVPYRGLTVTTWMFGSFPPARKAHPLPTGRAGEGRRRQARGRHELHWCAECTPKTRHPSRWLTTQTSSNFVHCSMALETIAQVAQHPRTPISLCLSRVGRSPSLTCPV